MFDAQLQCPIVALAHDDSHVPLVLVDQRLAQRRDNPTGALSPFPSFGGKRTNA
jgi:hypothetical protein